MSITYNIIIIGITLNNYNKFYTFEKQIDFNRTYWYWQYIGIVYEDCVNIKIRIPEGRRALNGGLIL